jgi:phytoene dehydrogenase-like protein
VCSAIHPMGAASPFFRSVGIGDWIHPDIPATHPLDDGRAAMLYRSLDQTADSMGVDGKRYRRYMGGLVDHADDLMSQVLGPLTVTPSHLSRSPGSACPACYRPRWRSSRFKQKRHVLYTQVLQRTQLPHSIAR